MLRAEHIEPAIRRILEREAYHRARKTSDKELSKKTGLTTGQVAYKLRCLVMAQRVRIEIERERG